MATEVIMPKLGLTMSEGSVVRWIKQDGETVKKGEPMFEVQTDKVVLEVEAPTDGTLRILVKEGVTVPVVSTIGWVLAPGEALPAGATPATAAAVAPAAEVSPAVAEAPAVMAEAGRVLASPAAKRVAKELGVDLTAVTGTGPGGRIQEKDVETAAEALRVKASPVAKAMAKEAGLDLSKVTGSGPDGRITKEDVERALGKAAPVPTAVPALAPTAPAPVAAPRPIVPAEAQTIPVTGIRQIIFDRMGTSSRTVARVTEFTEVDATKLVELRTKMKNELQKAENLSVSYNDVLVVIVAKALSEHRIMNATLVDNQIKVLPQINIGVAVDTERGLLVPVIRDANAKSVAQVARDSRGLIERAVAGRSMPDDLTGGTFTITNLGMMDIDGFTPIVNLPEIAILGVGRIQAKPAVVDGQIAIRQMMVLSLSFDHRIVDGAPAARFLKRVKTLIEDPYLLIL
jgi:pyruvate dehydrogenase E2 component (dihydrolipoamide acetyltransferase)